mmetsp:Transcript_9276/g.20633  ORF Transcript_9276/g.20633 Transcript_9276/m.20633 type:complete len:423 (+) Transcript_9276:61-1329(+)|eukprot:CAMPEP_0170631020 /NCGR_PEP_ID=MMETSP0224-20130122/34365_1 /TAXON_ID=285029 /ORGANISM="Togula jolla, Strain CCCM 725" /LENGTH=422 /DNA_ID=CAMNT_0010959225 /DNA_START=59 /DNA_END=1327 /DNA_ORIENTATION=+
MLPPLKELVNNLSCKGCYGIEWSLQDNVLKHKDHYNPEWRLAEVKDSGKEGLYTTHSASYEFMPGRGLVGQAFSRQEVIFVQNLQKMTPEGIAESFNGWDSTEFLRMGFAEEFGIHSAVFIPYPGGVIEIGSTNEVETMPSFLSDAGAAAVYANDVPPYVVEWAMTDGAFRPVGHYCPPGKAFAPMDIYSMKFTATADTVMAKALKSGQAVISSGKDELPGAYKRCPLAPKSQSVIFLPLSGKGVLEVGCTSPGGRVPNACSRTLSDTCKLLQAAIAVEWRLYDGKIKSAGHYNSPDRMSKCKENFSDTRYTLESYSYEFDLNESVVGRVFASGKSQLWPDLLTMPPGAFKRQALAEHFDVRTAVFIATKDEEGKPDGVLEICTDKVCEMLEEEILKSKGTIPPAVLAELRELSRPNLGSIY